MHPVIRILKKILVMSAYTLAGAIFGILLIYTHLMQSRPDLQPWQTETLGGEFTAEQVDEISTFQEYLELENQLFSDLNAFLRQNQGERLANRLIRYDLGSLADSTSYPINWNKSFELKQEKPADAVLLLHGLSDSPYSLRNLAMTLHHEGYHVLALRMPGHGTIPSALTESSWKDMAAAVKLAAKYLGQQTTPGKSFHMIGYSMGAAQAVNYALDSITDSRIPRPSSLVLISPAIGVSPVAALAIWQSRLSSIPGLEKLAWNSIAPEYDPYKYNSFAVNAGDQMYRLTLTIDAKIKSYQSLEEFREFPDTLAFLSAVDATVTASAVITRLFEKLQNDGNEFVLFDINRLDVLKPFIVKDPGEEIDKLLRHANPSYKLSLLSNRASDDLRISEISRSADGKLSSTDLPLKWPRDVYSLSHVALPFPAADALYGSQPENNNVPNLGLLSVKGERGVLGISAGDILRVKYNPFYEYLEKRTISFLSK